MDEHKIISNKELNIWEALIPVIALIGMLAFNMFYLGDDAGAYNNQLILLISAAVALVMGFFNKVSFRHMVKGIKSNLKSVFVPIFILLLVGALSASWLLSGIIPAMIYYGIKLINPDVFLPSAIVIASIVSLATGSSWTTSATIGVALIAIGRAIGLPAGMVAGAVISGAYFGDKMSPLSDTTNLAAAMAGTKLFTHIKYMLYTTAPSIIITILVFLVLSFTKESQIISGTEDLLIAVTEKFVISPWLFLVPLAVVVLIIKKANPIVALSVGVVLGLITSHFFQPQLLAEVSNKWSFLLNSTYNGIGLSASNVQLQGLLEAKGILGMFGTILLIICAMIFGGIMDSIGALARISQALLSIATSIFGLFASTVASCLALNITASDQYLAIVVPGKMFEKAYQEKGLAPENLSRTLEDSGTVTSVLIPWNTCGAYQSATLGVGVGEYFAYAIFNYISPFMTLLFAAFKIKIAELKPNKS
ncbi:Na+/H+ antiporter NhaC [Bacteroidia bacterium]|nr:Na+/H+ antiporter NhaC [Bacteroidia bacterium]MDB9883213.1 Na+/H+ antiporter NhaC [Bacteroidia bacterium]